MYDECAKENLQMQVCRAVSDVKQSSGSGATRIKIKPRHEKRPALSEHNLNIEYNDMTAFRCKQHNAKMMLLSHGSDVCQSSRKPQTKFKQQTGIFTMPNSVNYFSKGASDRISLTTNQPRQVVVIDPSTGKRLRIFPSCSEAARETGICRTKISRTCRKGGKLIGSHIYRYNTDACDAMKTTASKLSTSSSKVIHQHNQQSSDFKRFNSSNHEQQDSKESDFTLLEFDAAEGLLKLREVGNSRGETNLFPLPTNEAYKSLINFSFDKV